MNPKILAILQALLSSRAAREGSGVIQKGTKAAKSFEKRMVFPESDLFSSLVSSRGMHGRETLGGVGGSTQTGRKAFESSEPVEDIPDYLRYLMELMYTKGPHNILYK